MRGTIQSSVKRPRRENEREQSTGNKRAQSSGNTRGHFSGEAQQKSRKVAMPRSGNIKSNREVENGHAHTPENGPDLLRRHMIVEVDQRDPSDGDDVGDSDGDCSAMTIAMTMMIPQRNDGAQWL